MLQKRNSSDYTARKCIIVKLLGRMMKFVKVCSVFCSTFYESNLGDS
jgi:hypothetical protein